MTVRTPPTASSAAPPRLTAGDIYALIRDSALAFGQDKAPRLAAAISYYAMSSIAPLLLVAVAVAGFFLSDKAVLDSLFGTNGSVTQSLGQEGADLLRGLFEKGTIQRGSLTATIIGFVTLFMGSTGLFIQIQDALNSMWGADPPPPQGVVGIVKARIIAFLLILAIGLVLLVFLGLNTWLSALAQHLGDSIGMGAVAVRLGTFLLSALLLTPVFGAIYKFLPSVKLEWREVMIGGAITAVLFSLGQILIGIYFGRAAPSSMPGAAGTLVALLVWIYYSAMIFFFGAEATWVYSQKFGTGAGGAGNTAKKAALAEHGAVLDTTPSPQELEAQAAAIAQGKPIKDHRGRVIRTGRGRFPFPAFPARPRRAAPESELPSVSAALWNAFSAVLAVPTVIVLRLLGLGRRR